MKQNSKPIFGIFGFFSSGPWIIRYSAKNIYIRIRYSDFKILIFGFGFEVPNTRIRIDIPALKSPSWLIPSVKCLIVRDCHDKRLCVLFRYRSTVFHYFSCCFDFFCFSAQNGRLSISQKCDVTIRNFENKNFQNIPTLFFTSK